MYMIDHREIDAHENVRPWWDWSTSKC